ncbi:citrate synthase [Nakamurella lactea]|uniref:citrate synthase n=1 Tax=Nakamurella lactea TaxID=459515 RepID=UPI00048B7269|nr:citrate synthase [Nakamurella lactea]
MTIEPTPPPDHLSTEQAARVLGVKPETIYAYVSRGVLPKVTVSGRRGSWFPADLVETLRSKGPRNALTGMAERIHTRVTLLHNDRLYYRGREAVELADSSTFEQVCALLWQSEPAPLPPPAAVDRGGLIAGMPRRLDMVRTSIAVLAGYAEVRGDLSAAAVTTAARQAISTAIGVLPLVGAAAEPDAPAADRLWPAVTALPARRDRIRLLEAAMILLADHELASSTTAARVAAGTRADPYGVLTAALGAMDSPAHGAAASRARRLLTQAVVDPAAVISEYLAGERQPPGFGQLIYTERDPRADFLLQRIAELPGTDRGLLRTARRLVEEFDGRRGWFPNSDFALALLGEATGMVPDGGDVIFTISRLAGWTAHALEEYAEPPLRFRLHGLYVGERPGLG